MTPPPPPLKHQRMTVRMMVMRTFQRQPFLTLSRIWSPCTVDNTMKTILANTMKLIRASINIQNIKILRAPTQETTR